MLGTRLERPEGDVLEGFVQSFLVSPPSGMSPSMDRINHTPLAAPGKEEVSKECFGMERERCFGPPILNGDTQAAQIFTCKFQVQT